MIVEIKSEAVSSFFVQKKRTFYNSNGENMFFCMINAFFLQKNQ